MIKWQFGGDKEAIFSPMTGSEPEYEPNKWNNKLNIRKTHNCYAYVFDIVDPNFEKKPQPGYASGYKSLSDDEIRDCDLLMERILADNPSVQRIKFGDRCPEGYRKAYLAVDDSDNPDYHFYRLDKNGYWSHKPGSTSVTSQDGKKKLIIDPEKADRKGSEHHYKKSCSYFCYNPEKTNISNKEVQQLGGRKTLPKKRRKKHLSKRSKK